MRIRVGVRVLRVRLPADGCGREGGDEEEMDNGALCFPWWWRKKDDVPRVRTGSTDSPSCPAVASHGAAGTTDAAYESFSTTAPAAQRTTKGLGHAGKGMYHQSRQSGWQNLADFWYFADARRVPTIGSLKQQLLQSLFQGDFAVPHAAAAVLANMAHNFLYGQPQPSPQCPRRNCCDFWRCLQIPFWSKMSPMVVLRLQGALLPDDQPLHLLEKGDHVELCFFGSSLPPAPSESSSTSKAGTEPCTFMAYSNPLSYSAPSTDGALNFVHTCHNPVAYYNKGSVPLQRSSVAGSTGIRVCGCRRNRSTSGTKLEGKVVAPGRLATQNKPAATPSQQHIGKRRKVQEMRTEESYATLTCVQRNQGDVATQLPARTQGVAASGIPAAHRRVLRAAAKKKAKQAAHSSRKAATRKNVLVTVSRIRNKSRRSSTSSSSSSGAQGNNSRSSSECWEIRKDTLDAARKGRCGAVVGALPSVAGKSSQGCVASQGCFTGKSVGSGPAGVALAEARKERRFAPDKRTFSTKEALDQTMACTAATDRAEAPAVGDCPGTVASVPKVSSEGVLQQPGTAAAGRPSGFVNVQESSSEEESSCEEESSSEEGDSDAEDNVRERQLAQKKTKETPRSGAVAAAEAQGSLPQQNQQAQQASGKPLVASSRPASTHSDDSSSDASSTEESSSSSGEEDAINARGPLNGVRRFCGRMPAAVARAAAASVSRSSATTYMQQEERKTDISRARKADESAAAGGVASLHPPHSERAARRVGNISSCSQLRATPDCSPMFGGARSADGVGKAPCVREQGVHVNDKWYPRQQHQEEPQQQPQVERQRQQQGERQRQQQQQEKQRQPHQMQDEQEQRRGASWQLLVFKTLEDRRLAAVQAGEWLRVRLLHLVKGMPTLDAWKTVFVEATDVPAGRIKLWELRQRGPADGRGNSVRDSSSNRNGNDSGNRVNGGDQASEGECTMHVPFRKVAATPKGGAGRWCDWSELAYICTGTASEKVNAAEATPSPDTTAIPATGSTPGSASASLPAVAVAPTNGGDKAGLARESSTDNPRTVAAANVAAKAAGLAASGSPSAEMPQRSSAPLRYLPRRLLSLRKQSPNADCATEGDGAAAVIEPIASHTSTKGTTGGSSRVCLQPSLPVSSSSSSTSHGNSSVALPSTEKTDGSSVGTVVTNGLRNDDADAACDSLHQRKTAEASEGYTLGVATTLAGLPSMAAREKESEARTVACAAGSESQLTGAAAEGRGCSKAQDPILDLPSVARRTTEQRRTEAGGSGGSSSGVSAADLEKEQWEALISERLEIFLNEDEEALVASHPAAPTAAFHLPLPRELVQECSKRLESVRRNRKNARNKQHSDSTSASCGNDRHNNGALSASSDQSNGAGTNTVHQCEFGKESEQQQRGREGSAEVSASSGEDSTGKINIIQSSSNGRIERIIPTENWKGFDCVKACALRVVGEQLQHIRRALRRQVDYYFSPGNWQRDVYLRSRAVPLSSSRCTRGSATSYRDGSDCSDTFCCAGEAAGVHAQEHTRTTTLTIGGDGSNVAGGGLTVPNASSSGGDEKRAAEKEAVGEEKLAVNLDDVMAFPRMQGLSRDREFVAWCISSGGGLQHVGLERQGGTHWLVRNVATLQERTATKVTRQQ